MLQFDHLEIAEDIVDVLDELKNKCKELSDHFTNDITCEEEADDYGMDPDDWKYNRAVLKKLTVLLANVYDKANDTL